MHFLLYFLLITGFLLNVLQSAPTQSDKRKSKQLYYDDYLQSHHVDDDDDYHNDLDLNNDYVDDNDISRTIQQGRRRPKPNHQFESPIYYIRLPPQPYMFVPGLGYISQPPPPPPPPQSAVGDFLNVPVNFLSNGKPSTIYQWSGGVNFQTEAPPPVQRPVQPQRPDSTIHRLPGKYTFNGKPEDMFILRDSYNSLYSDALTNFYP